MKISRQLLYLASFVCLAALAAVAISRIGSPSMAATLVWTVVVASLAGAPGLIHRRAWPAAFVLLPIGAYLIARVQLPLPSTVHGLGSKLAGFYLDELRSGAHAYTVNRFPLDLDGAPDLKLFIAMCTYGATGLAAFVALSFRKAIPAVVITLALVGFGLTVDNANRVTWLPLAFVVLAGFTMMLSRSLMRQRWKLVDALAGGATAVTATLLALSVLGTTSVSASRPWSDWRAWGAGGTGIARISFDWMASFPSLLNPDTNTPVMTVTSAEASYWRANTLDSFTGNAWFSESSFGQLLELDSAYGAYSYSIPADEPVPGGKAVTEVFDVRGLSTRFLFTAGTPTKLVMDTGVSVYTNGAGALRLTRPREPKYRYAVTSTIPQIKAADLVGQRGGHTMGWMRFEVLPFPTAAEMTGPDPASLWAVTMDLHAADREWLGLYELNRSIVGTASDPYEIGLRIEKFLRDNYTYSLKTPRNKYKSQYAAFLFETKTGDCRHFAGAMAVLLRFNDIPARVALGFTSGRRQTDGTFLVSTNDAHAWVEAYFPRSGWVPFEPTPGNALPGAGGSSTSKGFVDPFVAGGRSPGSVPTQAQATGRPNQGPGRAGQHPIGSTAPSGSLDWLIWILVPSAALLLWPVGRATLQRRGLGRGSTEERLRVALRLVHSELRDRGVGVPPSQTLRETAVLLKDALDLDATQVVDRAEAVLFGGRVASERDLADVAALRREMRRRLRNRMGWARAALARYGIQVALR
jgi:transglutaminase-like putative cysteine protease